MFHKIKTTLVLLATALLIFSTGCKTGGVYDPVKTEKVRESIKPLVSTGVRVFLNAEPNPEYRNAAVAFSDVICEMRDTKVFDGKILANRLNAELTSRGLARDIWAATFKDLLVAQFNIWIADKVHADLPPDEFAWNVLDVMCDGVRSGLGNPI